MNRSLMAMKALRKHTAGFSLVEVMVVLVIIGIMAAIGMPAYQRYTYTARQSEATAMLRDILTSEKTELMKTGAYKAMAAMPLTAGAACLPGTADLSWSADNCPGLKYQYQVIVDTGVPPTKFVAIAKAFVKKYDRNTTTNFDTWVMDENGKFYQICDEVKAAACTALGTTQAAIATTIATMTPAIQ